MVCVPVTESSGAEFRSVAIEAALVAEMVELRLDYLQPEDLDGVLEWLGAEGLAGGAGLLLTFRPREQGGKHDLTLTERQYFWRGLSPAVLSRVSLIDFELDLVESWQGEPPIPWEKIICSWHDFGGTPDDLTAQYERMAATPAGIIKIATLAKSPGDSRRILELIDHARGQKPLIALGMGLAGVMTRVLSPSRGGVLTFAALRPGAESAAGQPTISEMRDRYRVGLLTRESEIYGVIGNPVGHSRSPRIHNAALAATGRNGVYLPLPVEDLDSFVRDLVRPTTRQLDWRLRGLSVTIPHKLGMMAHLDRIDETARRIGAVNTVVIEGDELHGYNTDVSGAMRPLERLIGLDGARVAVIGAGGSARAICHGLCERGANVTIFARDPVKAGRLGEEFACAVEPLERFGGSFDVVINCTPIGMHGHSEGESPLPPASLSGIGLVYDLVYTPEETQLLQDAAAAGCRTLGGLAMLVGQAAEQFRLWTGDDAPVDLMWEAARQWTVVSGRIVPGHQVASCPSSVYPAGTIEMQTPCFLARGLDLRGFFPGTINISIAPARFRLKHAAHYFRQVEWTDLHPPEDFSFCRCRLTLGGRTVEGLVYYPHPETKARHQQEKSTIEVIVPHLEGVHYGASVMLELLPDEVEIT